MIDYHYSAWSQPLLPEFMEFWRARRDHAFHLRIIDQLKYHEIAKRLDVTVERARQMVKHAGRDAHHKSRPPKKIGLWGWQDG